MSTEKRYWPQTSRQFSSAQRTSSTMSSMVDLTSIKDLAYNFFDSSQNKGLPFGTYLHSNPPRRQRALTGPLDPTHESFWHKIQVLSSVEPEQRTYLQEQCGFLWRLPLDIRLMIYEMVLGGNYFHVTTNESKSRILSHACKRNTASAEGDHQACFSVSSTERRPSSAPREDCPFATGFLPLLATCRRIYSEAIDILYSANTFEFWENRVALRFLKQTLPTQRLRSIRRFRWDMQIPHHPDINARSRRDWSDLFAFFANETSGLKHLYLKLKKNHPTEAVIAQTRDEDASGWIRPIVLMAVEANRKRGCRVEIATNGVVHEPEAIFRSLAAANPSIAFEKLVELACIEMHRRVRVSLAGNG